MYSDEELRLLSEILPNVASQLRGAMGNLHAAIHRAAPESENDPASQRSRCIMEQSYYRMLRLINNLSASSLLAETGDLPTQNVELVEWLDGLCRQAQPLAADLDLTVRFACTLQAHVAAIHPEYMERVVWNLLSNAMKFTPAGGEITVSLRLYASQVLVSVKDTGCGISEELRDTVFDRYLHTSRLDPEPHGLGLGLPLCRRIAEGHGGRLMIDSETGKGTTVTVALPDRRSPHFEAHDVPFHYAGGFQPVMMELADALPYQSFRRENLD